MVRARVGLVSNLDDAAEYEGRCTLILTRGDAAPKRWARAICGGVDAHGSMHLGGQGTMVVWGPNQDEVAKFLRRVPPKLSLLVVLPVKPEKDSKLEASITRETKNRGAVRVVILKKKGDIACVDCEPGGKIVDAKPSDAVNPSSAPSTPTRDRKRIPPSKRRHWRSGPEPEVRTSPNVTRPAPKTAAHAAPNVTRAAKPAAPAIPPRAPSAKKVAASSPPTVKPPPKPPAEPDS